MSAEAIGAELLSIGKTALNIITAGLANPPAAGSNTEDISVAIERIWTTFGEVIGAIGYDMQQEAGAKIYETPVAKAVRDQTEHSMSYVLSSINHVTFTILPESLKYLHGRIYGDWILPLDKDVTWAKQLIIALWNWSHDMNLWRKNTVDPHLVKLDNFLHDFFAGDQPSLNILIDWLRHPAHFGTWATPVLAYDLPWYWLQHKDKVTRDMMGQAALTAFTELPEYVAAAAVAILNAPVD